MLLGIIDLGINNLTSVHRAFTENLKPKDSLVVIETDIRIEPPDLVILPGLGKFDSGMSALKEKNLIDKIKNWQEEGTKIVGICLGMQLLGSYSEESRGVEGLDLINSRIERLPENQNERVPHTGWAAAMSISSDQPFPSLTSSGDFYFVHSYHVIPSNDKDVLTTTPFGNHNFVSSIFSRNVLGFQFHPEKSGNKGLKLISEVMNWARQNES